jgi:hypothetical protein
LSSTGNTTLGDASTDTLNVGNGDLIKDASGNVGVGRTPVNKVDVGYSMTSQSSTGINGSVKLVRLSSGEAGVLFTTDINTAGALSGTQTSSAQVGYVYYSSTFPTDFVIGTNTQTVASNLRFYNNNAEVMRLDSSGNLLVGTTATTSGARFSLVSSNNTTATYNSLFKNSSGTILFAMDDGGSFYTGLAASSPWNATTASGANVVLVSSGQLQRSTSSLKYKTDVENAAHGLAEVLKLRSVTYKGKNDGDIIFGGLIAEEVDEAGLTEFVTYAEDGSPDALAYGQMVSLAFKAIQEQQALITSLTARLDTQADQIKALQGAK